MPRATSTLLTLLLGLHAVAQVFIPCSPYGGKDGVERLWQQELQWPTDSVEGEVYLIFAVLEDGSVRGLRIWRSLSPACDAEALRVARMVRWHPAWLGEKPVAAEHYLIVPFDRKRITKWERNRRAHSGPVFHLPADTAMAIHRNSILEQAAVPVVPGGIGGLPLHLVQRMTYPPDAYRRDIEGVVRAEFVVEPSGTLSNLRTVEGLGGGCNEEALRLLQAVEWLPAVRNGKRVRSVVEVSIQFKLPR